MSVLAGYGVWLLGELTHSGPAPWFAGLGIIALFGVIWQAFAISLKRRL